jgi:ADP-dependent NAD(P)H-hydrate dehydratase / NAD(P)H-hydrate epimerase
MRSVLGSLEHLPLHGTASSRAWESQALAATPTHQLMQRAGAAVAKLALALCPHARQIHVACGPGNNGGDGLVAARLLQAAGKHVGVSLCAGASQPPDAAWALQAAKAEGLTIEAGPPERISADLVIDALLGLGVSRAPEGAIAAATQAINAQAAPVLAIDLPSGLNADNGQAELAVRAQHTLSLLTLKPGLFTAQGRALAGEIWWDKLGQPARMAPTAWLLGRQALLDWQHLSGPRAHDSHKGRQGDVLVVGGAPGMRGAAWLAARAALAAGAGRVHACLLDVDLGASAPADRPELMNWPESRLKDSGSWQRHVVVAGCGGGAAVARHLPELLTRARRLVLDADGLNALGGDAALRQLLRARQAQGQATILTPHPLEAARLLDSSSAEVQADRIGAAQALSLDLRCSVLLKGSGTVIASPDRLPAINSSGNASLATAGTGDVLAGWLGGLWTQYAGEAAGASHVLACAGAQWHGLAAGAPAAGPLRAAELIERMYGLHGAP